MLLTFDIEEHYTAPATMCLEPLSGSGQKRATFPEITVSPFLTRFLVFSPAMPSE